MLILKEKCTLIAQEKMFVQYNQYVQLFRGKYCIFLLHYLYWTAILSTFFGD